MKYAGYKHISYCFISKESRFSQVAIHKGFHEGRLTLSSTPLLQLKKLSLYFESLDRRTLHEPRGLDIFSLLFCTTLHDVINYLKIWKQESFVCSSSENGNMSTNMMACKNVYTHTRTHTSSPQTPPSYKKVVAGLLESHFKPLLAHELCLSALPHQTLSALQLLSVHQHLVYVFRVHAPSQLSFFCCKWKMEYANYFFGLLRRAKY